MITIFFEIVVIIALLVLFLFEKERNNKEQDRNLKSEKQMLKMISDLNDKVYFLRTHEYIAKKSIEEPNPEVTEDQYEEEGIPIEDVTGEQTRDIIASLMREKKVKVV